MKLEPSGERMILEHYASSPEDQVIMAMHLATYDFAKAFVHGKRVLDYGCGSGYGSALVAPLATSVEAVDVAQDAVDFANEQYTADNLRFARIDPDKPLPFAADAFDIVLSFQVFEHVAQVDEYLREVNRVLAPGGVFLLVTPDRSTRLLPLQQPWNRWHLTEYSARSLKLVLLRQFAQVEMLKMSGKPEVIGVELRRCRRLKWLSLPMTLPVYPHRLRVGMLNMIHRWRARDAAKKVASGFTAHASDITIGPGLSPSLNLVAVVRKRGVAGN
jgi:SAM-dependent methyltransferase